MDDDCWVSCESMLASLRVRFAGCFVGNAANQTDEEDSNNLDAPLFIDEFDHAIEVANDEEIGTNGYSMEMGDTGDLDEDEPTVQQQEGKGTIDKGTILSPAKEYLRKIRMRSEKPASESKTSSSEYQSFDVDRAKTPDRRAGPQVGSHVWASDVASRAAAVVELTRGWDTRGRVLTGSSTSSTSSKTEAYARFVEQEKLEQEARARQEVQPEPEAAPCVVAEPPKIGKARIKGLGGPKVKPQPSAAARQSNDGASTKSGEDSSEVALKEPLLPTADC